VPPLRLGRQPRVRPRQGDDREALDAGADFGRYLDVDGDGIPYRTYPGTHPTKGGYFTRGTTKNAYAGYSEAGADYIYNMQRLRQKFETAKSLVPLPVLTAARYPARFAAIFYGSTGPAMQEALDALAEQGIYINALRVRAFPFQNEIADFIASHSKVFVLEQNFDGQLTTLLINEAGVNPASLIPVLHYDGTPITARFITQEIAERVARLNVRPLRETWWPEDDLPCQTQAAPPEPAKNRVGYTRRDYEGKISTLCAGCGHDSISAAIIQACWELDIEPHRVAKLSGIGCSSKTPDYFLGNSHGFNTVHGRMPSVLTGAYLANRELIYLGVSGDGDSASIGLGQFAHVMRRGVNMTYLVENNGVYGLTKGQFSATADKGSKSKKGQTNNDAPIDLVTLALVMGATFVARGFSGDKTQLVPLIRAALAHQGAAVIDVLSPCIAFNNHSRQHQELRLRARAQRGGQPPRLLPAARGNHRRLRRRRIDRGAPARRLARRLRKLHADYDPTDRIRAMSYVQEHAARGEVVTGLLYVDGEACRPAPTARHRRDSH
jgi:2-oxoglutarate ferredoxin oxidoreductase subunit beta